MQVQARFLTRLSTVFLINVSSLSVWWSSYWRLLSWWGIVHPQTSVPLAVMSFCTWPFDINCVPQTSAVIVSSHQQSVFSGGGQWWRTIRYPIVVESCLLGVRLRLFLFSVNPNQDPSPHINVVWYFSDWKLSNINCLETSTWQALHLI